MTDENQYVDKDDLLSQSSLEDDDNGGIKPIPEISDDDELENNTNLIKNKDNNQENNEKDYFSGGSLSDDNNEPNIFSEKTSKKENSNPVSPKLNSKKLEKVDPLPNNNFTNRFNKNSELNKIYLGALKNNFIKQNNDLNGKNKLINLPKVNKNNINKNNDNKKENNEDKIEKEEKKENKETKVKSINEEKEDNKKTEKPEDKNNIPNNMLSDDELNCEEIEQISDIDDVNVEKQTDDNTNNEENKEKIEKKEIENIVTKETELNDDDSLYDSLSSSLNENIENQIGGFIDDNNENDSNTFMKQMLVETNKHYIKEQRQQTEKLKQWAIKDIYNIISNNIILKLQKSFFNIQNSKKQLIEKKGNNFFRCYEKYKTKFKKECLKKYFFKLKIKSIELKPKIEKIIDLITELSITNENIETAKKIKTSISKKITEFTGENDQEELPTNSTPNNENEAKEENTETTENITIPPPPPPPMIPPPPPVPAAPSIPPPPGAPPLVLGNFSNVNIPDVTKNLPKLPKDVNARKLQWQKVNYDLYNNSFWSKLEDEQEKTKNNVKVDFELLQNVFTVSKVKKEEKKVEKPVSKKKDVITILDGKRLMNVSISLKKMKINKDKLQQLIKAYDIDNILDLDLIQTINNIFPSDEEKRQLLEYNGDLTKLSEPDNFCRMLVSIENCKKILEILEFKKQLPEKINDILLKIHTLQECTSSINNSEQFKSILYLIRQMGNYLNTGTSNGKALGFSISFLDKLDMIKGYNKEKSNFLEIFTTIIKKDNVNLLNFYKEFKKLDEASNCNKDELDKQIALVQKGITGIQNEKEKTKEENYLMFLNNTENYCSAKMDCINLTNKFLDNEIEKTISIFGENPKNFNLSSFIKIIKNFTEKFKKCLLEISQKEARLLKKMIMEEKKKKKKENMKTVVNADIKKICDNTRKTIARKTHIKNNLCDIREFVKSARAKIRENKLQQFGNNEIKETNKEMFNDIDLIQKGVKVGDNGKKKVNKDAKIRMIINQQPKSERKNYMKFQGTKNKD